MTAKRLAAAAGVAVTGLAAVAFLGAAPSALALDNGLGALPVMGWSTWCTDDLCGLLDLCFEKEIMSIADAMVSTGMKDLGYDLIFLDDCWANHSRSANGTLVPDPTRFPSGMRALADYVHDRGLKFGLYTCVGNKTCKFDRAGSWGHFDQDAATFVLDYDADYVKMDNCGHPDESSQVYMTQFSKALNATGKATWFDICAWGTDEVWLWGPEVGNSFRISLDHLPLWSYGKEDNGQGTLQIIDRMANVSSYTMPGGYDDPDFLETLLFSFTYNESVTEMSFWSLWGTPLIITTDIRNNAKPGPFKDITMNADVIAVNQDAANVPGTIVWRNETSGAEVWQKPLAGARGTSAWSAPETVDPAPGARDPSSFNKQAIIAFNRNNEGSQDIIVSWADLGWSETDVVEVYDVWAHKSLGSFTGAATAASVPPHGVAMWTISRSA